MDSIYLYILGYLVAGIAMWDLAPQAMTRHMPRHPRTHKYTPKVSSFVAITIFWPLALIQRR
jgi:hypothetical protein